MIGRLYEFIVMSSLVFLSLLPGVCVLGVEEGPGGLEVGPPDGVRARRTRIPCKPYHLKMLYNDIKLIKNYEKLSKLYKKKELI